MAVTENDLKDLGFEYQPNNITGNFAWSLGKRKIHLSIGDSEIHGSGVNMVGSYITFHIKSDGNDVFDNCARYDNGGLFVITKTCNDKETLNKFIHCVKFIYDLDDEQLPIKERIELFSDVRVITDNNNYAEDFKEYIDNILASKDSCEKFMKDAGIHKEDDTLHENYGG